jgi:hypothetical protein
LRDLWRVLVALLTIVLSLLVTTAVAARTADPEAPSLSAGFALMAGGSSGQPPSPNGPIADPTRSDPGQRPPGASAAPHLATNASRSSLPSSASRSVRGRATHYGFTHGFGDVPSVALPGPLGGRYTGRINGYATVCADRCVRLPVVDYCACSWGTVDQRVADLSDAAWPMVSDSPISRGIVPVIVYLE